MTIESRVTMLRTIYHVFEEVENEHDDYECGADARNALQEAFVKLCEVEGVPVKMMIRELHLTYNEHGWLSGWMQARREDFEK